jgi:LPXTG-motif cell wall-anchored protein
MYKAGKLWLFAGISFVGTMVILGGNPVAASTTDDANSDANTSVKSDTEQTGNTVQLGQTQGQSAVQNTTSDDAAENKAVDDSTQKATKTTQSSTGATKQQTDTSSAEKEQQTTPAATQGQADTTGKTADAANTDAVAQENESGNQQQAVSTEAAQSVQPAATTKAATVSRAAAAPVQKTQVDATSTTMTLQSQKDTIQSGETASFDFNLNVSGIETDGSAQKLVINLPSNFTLTDTDLSINGVTPTQDATNHQLIYDFATPQNGLTASKQFNFETQSGDIVNGTKLTMSAVFTDGEKVVETGDQSVTVTSKAVYGVAIQFDGVLPSDGNGNLVTDANGQATIDRTKITGRAGDLVAYTVGISAPKQTLGQAFIAPGTVVQVRVALPAGMTYRGVDNSTPTPQVSTQGNLTILDFFITAPSIAEQEAAATNLISQQFNIVALINSAVPYGTNLTVQALMGATTINGDTVSSAVATSTIKTVPNYIKVGVPTNGSVDYLYVFSPKIEGKSSGSASSSTNQDPTVAPSDTLIYSLSLGPADFMSSQQNYMPEYISEDPSLQRTSEGYLKPIQAYVATYDIDQHLNVNTLMIAPPTGWVEGNDVALDEKPTFNLYVKYQDAADFESTPILSGITDTNRQTINLNDLLDNQRGVDKLQFVWTNTVAGQKYGDIEFTMTPKAGYYGTVANSLTVDVTGFVLGDGWLQVHYSEDGAKVVGTMAGWNGHADVGSDLHDNPTIWNQFMTSKTAEIAKPAENTPRVINESISFAKTTDGKADTGANQLLIGVDNNKASLQSFSGLTSYVTLPEGVTYTGNDAQVSAQTVDGKTLLTINWQRNALAPNSANTLSLDVDIDAKLNLGTMGFGLYSTVTEPDTVVPRTIDPTAASDVQILQGASLPGLQLSQNVYALEILASVNDIAGHQVKAEASATNTDSDSGSLVTVRANEDGQYVLSFAPTTDAALQNLTLTATLPRVGDTAVLATTARGTTTNDVQLSGPIQLPASWQGKATVRYITAAAPDGLVEADVTDFSAVTGFTITYDDPQGYVDGGEQQIIVPVHVAGDAAEGTQALISYAVAANGLTQAEGLKAGITVGARQQANATVTYHDATTDTDLAVVNATTDSSLVGDLDTTSTYSSAAAIAAYLAQGYQLVSDGTKNADGSSAIKFTTGGATTNYVVTLKHAYTASAVKTVTRTIHYVDGSGKTLTPDHVDSQSFLIVTDHVTGQAQTYTSTGTTAAPTLTDGKPDSSDWTLSNSASFAAVANPSIKNYKVTATTAADGDLKQVTAANINSASANQTVTVTYGPDAGEVSTPVAAGDLTVRYVDENGKTLLPDVVKSGYVGNAYAVTAPSIKNYVLKSVPKVSGSFTKAAQTVTFVYGFATGEPGAEVQAGDLTVRYVDRNGKTLLPNVVKSGYVGNAFSVTAPSINGYTLQSSASEQGHFTKAAQTVTFVYKQIPGRPAEEQPATLTIHYVTADGTIVQPATTKAAYVGNAYAVTPPAIAGYQYVGLGNGSAPLSGHFAQNATDLVLVYKLTAGGTAQPDTPDQPGHELPSTDGGGTATPGNGGTQAVKTALPNTATTAAETPANSVKKNAAQRTLPQTGETHNNLAVLLGLGLMSLLSGAWFRKRQH